MEQFQYQFKQYAKSGYAANDDYIISSKLTPSYSKPGSLAVDLTQNFNEIYAVITGSSVEVKTFVYAPNTEAVIDATTPYSPLYGNPLELEKIDLSNIDPDTQFSEQSLALLSLRKAKKILSRVTYSITNKIENSDFLPLAVLCDGANNNAGLYFVIISTENTPEGITEAFKTETISSCGPFPNDKWKKGEKGENEAFLSDILLNLPSQLHTFNSEGEVPRGKLAMQIFSRYELFGESDAIIKSIDENLSVSHASVDVFSNEVTEVLQTSSLNVSKVSVNLRPMPGDIRSTVYFLYQDIRILEGLMQVFGAKKQIVWAEIEEEEENVGNRKSTMDKLNEVLASFYNPSRATNESKQGDKEEDTVTSLFVPRSELDFTEAIWEVLKKVQSSHELVQCLEVLVHEIKQGKGKYFWLHEGNNSFLGKLIRQSYKENVTIPKFDLTFPIQVLIEIGAGKLQRDYVQFFFSHRFATREVLAEYTSFDDAISDVIMLQRTMEGLRKLHHVTELATLCQANLMLPVEKIRSAVRSALQSYVAEEVNFHKLFSFDVSLTDVKWIIESSSPSVWRVNKLGANAFGEDSGSACWTRDFPFSGLVQQPAVNCDMSNLSVTSQDEITDAYYVTTATQSHFYVD